MIVSWIDQHGFAVTIAVVYAGFLLAHAYSRREGRQCIIAPCRDGMREYAP